ncbi:hypothetical protein NLX83_36340 [Allokutzneria sp. A3M-2-11 16]|uniref:hypothetical protein n=1 Tax=Allokutzneria sp. A3M-2-11 16 TaxID=2962043 RepID=UPI0020B6E434|nr:hypothetical protein [Allokutzneria sp. A3M-2-11 16]MCP3804750.1 hypothetical protein [Allokutzneria sp. A3M-2-11 16]
MTRTTIVELASRMVWLGMLSEEKAVAFLTDIGKRDKDYLDKQEEARDLVPWFSELGVAFSVHGEDVDSVAQYYRYLLEEEVSAVTGVTFSDVVLVRDEDGDEALHFLRDGEPVWWRVEHVSEDYADQGAFATQIGDLEPGAADPRVFHHVRPEKVESCQDDVYLLATPDQARALHEEFGFDLSGLDRKEAVEDPGTWLSEMDSSLAVWRKGFLPAEFPFDFSPGSLDALESLVRARFSGWDAVKDAADDPFVVGAVRYLGETVLRNAPARWDYDGRVVLRADVPAAFSVTEVPLHLLCRVAESSEPGTLREVVDDVRQSTRSYRSALRLLEEQSLLEKQGDA